jgi:hypothetical protein
MLSSTLSKISEYRIPFLWSAILIIWSLSLPAQNDSLRIKNPKISISGVADVFYVYDFNQPQGLSRQPFLYNHNRHNEFNLNLGLLKLSIEHKNIEEILPCMPEHTRMIITVQNPAF